MHALSTWVQRAARHFAIGLSVALFAGPVSAGWEQTRWGMSLDEVRHTNPTLQPATDAEQASHSGALGPPRLKGAYRQRGRDFVSWFYFRDAALARVRLDAADRHAASTLLQELLATYGTPVKQLNAPFQSCDRYDVVWHDLPRRTAVRFEGVSCAEQRHQWTDRASIYYDPLPE